MPGMVTGPLNVNTVCLSGVCAAPAMGGMQVNRAAVQAKKNRLGMVGLQL
jgi:hypothetical protein